MTPLNKTWFCNTLPLLVLLHSSWRSHFKSRSFRHQQIAHHARTLWLEGLLLCFEDRKFITFNALLTWLKLGGLNAINCPSEHHLTLQGKRRCAWSLLLPQSASDPQVSQKHFPFPELINRVWKGVGRGRGERGPLCEAGREWVNEWEREGKRKGELLEDRMAFASN